MYKIHEKVCEVNSMAAPKKLLLYNLSLNINFRVQKPLIMSYLCIFVFISLKRLVKGQTSHY